MVRRLLAIVGGLALMWAWLVTASPTIAAADPVTGTWTGQLAPTDMPRPIEVTMTLRLDSHNSVTGSVSGLPNPADVKVGSFDPKSAQLELQLGKTGDPKVLLVLQGKVEGLKASGTISGDGTGTFTMARKP